MLFGDSRAALRASVKRKLAVPGLSSLPPEAVDGAVDSLLGLVSTVAPGFSADGALLTSIQQQRGRLRREWSAEFSRTVQDVPILGDAASRAKVGDMLFDGVFDLLLRTEQFEGLRPPAERLRLAEERVALVKAELGVLRLLWIRLVQRRRALALLLATAHAAALYVGAAPPPSRKRSPPPRQRPRRVRRGVGRAARRLGRGARRVRRGVGRGRRRRAVGPRPIHCARALDAAKGGGAGA